MQGLFFGRPSGLHGKVKQGPSLGYIKFANHLQHPLRMTAAHHREEAIKKMIPNECSVVTILSGYCEEHSISLGDSEESLFYPPTIVILSEAKRSEAERRTSFNQFG